MKEKNNQSYYKLSRIRANERAKQTVRQTEGEKKKEIRRKTTNGSDAFISSLIYVYTFHHGWFPLVHFPFLHLLHSFKMNGPSLALSFRMYVVYASSWIHWLYAPIRAITTFHNKTSSEGETIRSRNIYRDAVLCQLFRVSHFQPDFVCDKRVGVPEHEKEDRFMDELLSSHFWEELFLNKVVIILSGSFIFG